MNDKDQPIAAAQRPHRQDDDRAQTQNTTKDDTQSIDRKLSFWGKIRAKLAFRAPTLRQDLQEALEDTTNNGFDAAFSDGERASFKTFSTCQKFELKTLWSTGPTLRQLRLTIPSLR